MASFDYTIKDVHGIHARPATELFKLSKQFGSAVKAAKDGKEVASTYPDFLFDPIRLEYNGEEYHIQLEKECKKSESELRYTEDYF